MIPVSYTHLDVYKRQALLFKNPLPAVPALVLYIIYSNMLTWDSLSLIHIFKEYKSLIQKEYIQETAVCTVMERCSDIVSRQDNRRAVSYTHLDVYKRQLPRCCGRYRFSNPEADRKLFFSDTWEMLLSFNCSYYIKI